MTGPEAGAPSPGAQVGAARRRFPRVAYVVLVAVAIALALTGCVPQSDIRTTEPIGTLEVPRTELGAAGARIARFDPPGAGSQLELRVPVDVTNPNGFPVRIVRIDYRLHVEGIEVGVGSVEPDLELAAGSSARLRLDPVADLGRQSRLLTAVVRAFAGQPLAIELLGEVSFASPGFSFTSRTRSLASGAATALQRVAAPELAFDAGESDVVLLRPEAPVVRVVMRAANPGDIGYFLYGRDLTLAYGGEVIATEDLRPQPLPAGREGRIDLLFYPSWTRMSDGARAAVEAALAGRPMLVEVSGELRMDVLGIDSFDVPAGWSVGGPVRSNGASDSP